LLAEAMAAQRARTAPPRFRWRATAMGALVDIADKEALLRVLDQDT
jgi:hypothetical protein